MTALLQVTNLSVQIAERTLVKGLDFTVLPGERWCVIGRNAVGKSTLLRALAGLHAPHPASSVIAEKGLRRAYMPQSPQDRFDLTVRELMALQPAAALDAAQLDARCNTLATALDIAPLLDRPITQLSGGERQRAGLAAVAAQNAPLWLLDEPVSFQDPAHQRMVAQWLHQHPQAGMVMSAHDMTWVQSVATHLIAACAHKTWACGPIDAVLNAQLLHDTFDCEWQQMETPHAGRVWMAV